jgi:hypothetical protein
VLSQEKPSDTGANYKPASAVIAIPLMTNSTLIKKGLVNLTFLKGLKKRLRTIRLTVKWFMLKPVGL